VLGLAECKFQDFPGAEIEAPSSEVRGPKRQNEEIGRKLAGFCRSRRLWREKPRGAASHPGRVLRVRVIDRPASSGLGTLLGTETTQMSFLFR